jgi:hypothetical protein
MAIFINSVRIGDSVLADRRPRTQRAMKLGQESIRACHKMTSILLLIILTGPMTGKYR